MLEQLQIGAYQQKYDIDTVKVQHDAAKIRSNVDQIRADISRVKRDHKRLQSEAVSAYINLSPEVRGTDALFDDEKRAPTVAEYEEVASGDISLTIAALHTDQKGLRAQRAVLEQLEARDQATTSQEATLTNAARQTEVQLSSKQSEIRASSPLRSRSSRRHRRQLPPQPSGRHRQRVLRAATAATPSRNITAA